MPRFTHPISWRLTNTEENAAGPVRITLRARLYIDLQDRDGNWTGGVEFVIDTGASFPVMRTALARSLHLPVPAETSTVALTTGDGRREAVVRDGELRIRFPELPDQHFPIKCVFRDDQPEGVPPVLGLHNTLDLFRLRFDGTPLPHGGAMSHGDGFMGYMEFVTRDS